MKYIDDISGGEHDVACIFCQKPATLEDEAQFILRRGKHCFALLNIYPYNTGHLMVAPYRHVADLEALNMEESSELLELATLCVRAIKECMQPEGMNMGINLGKAAGAGFDAHLHLHVVPRWVGDTNFMPVVGETKVLPEALEQTYARIKSALNRL
jgi:ATP adenylyltransferase